MEFGDGFGRILGFLGEIFSRFLWSNFMIDTYPLWILPSKLNSMTNEYLNWGMGILLWNTATFVFAGFFSLEDNAVQFGK